MKILTIAVLTITIIVNLFCLYLIAYGLSEPKYITETVVLHFFGSVCLVPALGLVLDS